MVLRSAKASRPSLAKPDAAVPGGRLWETVDFPEEDFARSLRDHSGLLALHAGALYAGLRRSYAEVSEDEPLELRRESFSQEARLFLGHAAQQLGVITSLEGEEDTVEVLDTLEALERLPPAARSVRRALVHRTRLRFRVVVVTNEAISMRDVGLEAEDLENPLSPIHLYLEEDPDLVVEPRVQSHRRIGRWLVSLAVSPRHLLRVDLVPRPFRASSIEELVDHIFAAAATRLRQFLWNHFLGKSTPQMEWLSGSDADGIDDAVGLVQAFHHEVVSVVMTRAIVQNIIRGNAPIWAAIEGTRVEGWMPVLVTMRHCTGVRWLKVMEGGDPEPPPVTVARNRGTPAGPRLVEG